MHLLLLGVRGSTPTPGAEFVRHGGHTSCVAVVPDGATAPVLLLDAGTGIRSLTDLLGDDPFRGSILLSHLHWDHVEGLPFCRAVDRDDAEVRLFVPAQDDTTPRDLLARTLSPPSFPIEPEGLQGSWEFLAMETGTIELEGLTVTAADIAHKGGRTMGYRISDGSSSLAYLPDHAPSRGMSEEARALVRGVDVLLHDAQFLETEREVADLYGHATIEETIALAKALDVRRLVLFHHSPVRTDDQLDEISAHLCGDLPVDVAFEGMRLEVGA